MEVSGKGQTYFRGKPLDNNFRSLIIDEIVEMGGDIITGYFPGDLETVASKLKITKKAAKMI